ncbi:MAG: DUF4097 domain-containing protein [Tissierellia bacterium]|nr:hypothetical protein [Bacillota bacterium]NLL22601.1 DUF4097 domain-containing protein [Tissierellia bacterium]
MSRYTRMALILLTIGAILIFVGYTLGGSYLDLSQTPNWTGIGDTIESVIGFIRDHRRDEGSLRSFDQEYNVDPAGICDIKVNWLDGEITIKTEDVQSIMIREWGSVKNAEKDRLFYRKTGSNLIIDYSEREILNNIIDKNLEIVLPHKMSMENIRVNCMDAELDIEMPVLKTVKIECMSGEYVVKVDTEQLFFDSMSGKLEFFGELENFRGNTMDGDVVLHLRKMSGFSLKYSSMSGSLISEIPLLKSDEIFYCGDRKADYQLESMSGNITIVELP